MPTPKLTSPLGMTAASTEVGAKPLNREDVPTMEPIKPMQQPIASAKDCPICGYSLCKHGFCRDETCANYLDSRGWGCQDCGEAQEQERIANYYGGDTPQNELERFQVERMRE